MISLVPPRNPLSQKAKDRRWVLIVPRHYGADHIDLYGTHINRPDEAKTVANCALEHDYTWEPRGMGFEAKEITDA
jgi:hypothetical protein